jgi:hypothetical protein
MKLFKYPNGRKLKRKNNRIRLTNSSKYPNNTFFGLEIFDKDDGHFVTVYDKRGIKGFIARLSDETLELLACMIIDHLTDKRK